MSTVPHPDTECSGHIPKRLGALLCHDHTNDPEPHNKWVIIIRYSATFSTVAAVNVMISK